MPTEQVEVDPSCLHKAMDFVLAHLPTAGSPSLNARVKEHRAAVAAHQAAFEKEFDADPEPDPAEEAVAAEPVPIAQGPPGSAPTTAYEPYEKPAA